MYESLHKVMTDALKKTIVKEEQTYSKQPMLLAHPSSVKAIKGGRLDQLLNDSVKEFMDKGYCIVNDFYQDKQGVEKLYERMELMEIEGRFQIQRSLLPPEQRLRSDKIFTYNITEIEKITEFSNLHKLTQSLYFLAFELNKHHPQLQLQVSEHFELSFYSGGSEHNYFRRHMDSDFGQRDTGVKVTMMYIFNSDKDVDRSYGKLSFFADKDGDQPGEEIFLRHNTLVIIKSRKLSYQITEVDSKVFVLTSKISGPQDPSQSS